MSRWREISDFASQKFFLTPATCKVQNTDTHYNSRDEQGIGLKPFRILLYLRIWILQFLRNRIWM